MQHVRWRALSRLAILVVLPPLAVAACFSNSVPARLPAAAGRGVPMPAATPTKTTTTKPPTTSAPHPSAPTTSAAPAPAPTTTTAPAPPPVPAPVWAGKGMWIWQPEYSDGGDGSEIVQQALADGIKTLFVRTGSSKDGLTIDWAMDLLPIAHAAGVRVVGWDFPELDDIDADAARAAAAVSATAADGTHLDGFAADIETASEGTNLTPQHVFDYGYMLRQGLTPVPLIVCVPNPSPQYQGFYPYAEAISWFDAVAPMVYWLNRDPASDVAQAVDFLAQFQKPVAPIGQAFDGGLEGGRDGQPSAYELSTFAQTALEHGASGLSFWSWQHADDNTFANIRTLPEVGIH